MSDRKRGAGSGRRTLSQIFMIPSALGIVSAIGLVAALVGDGAWDAAGWMALSVPAIVTMWCLWGRRRSPR